LGLCSAETLAFRYHSIQYSQRLVPVVEELPKGTVMRGVFFDVAFFCFVSHRDCFRASGVIGGIGSISFCLFLQHLLFYYLFLSAEWVTFSSVFSACFWGRRSSCLTDALLSSHCALSHPVSSVLVGSATTPPLYIGSVFLKNLGNGLLFFLGFGVGSFLGFV